MAYSLTADYKRKTIFSSDGKWLFPLFEMEEYLHAHQVPAAEIFLTDTVCGIAGAGIIAYLGVKKCHLKLISEKAVAILDADGIDFSWDKKVAKIDCMTEDLLDTTISPQDIYRFIRKRAGLVSGRSVECSGLSVSYGNRTVLEGLDFRIDAGATAIIRGDNGTGKTTFLKALAGLVPHVSGLIKIDDKIVSARSSELIAYVPQETSAANFPVTAFDVVAMARAGKRKGDNSLAYEVEIAAKRCQVYDLLTKPYNSLSGGQKQRIQLARCLCQKAGIILLDEPFNYLDDKSRFDFFDILEYLHRSSMPTVVIVSHDTTINEADQWKSFKMIDGRLC